MVTARNTFMQMRDDYLNSDLQSKASPVIAHIEKRLLAMIDCSNNNIMICVPDELWSKHIHNNRQMDILKAFISNQYKKAGWTHVNWRLETGIDVFHQYSITLG